MKNMKKCNRRRSAAIHGTDAFSGAVNSNKKVRGAERCITGGKRKETEERV